MSNTALVTGANGFVGDFLVSYLKSRGWQVRGSVLPPMAPSDAVFPCDITDAAQVDALVQWAGPVSHVFHLAAVTFIPLSQSDPTHTMDINLNGTIRLTEAVRRYAPDARFLYVGSAAVYGIPRELPITEEHPLQPNEPYAISKAAADTYCEYLYRNYAMDTIRLRPFNHSGPSQSPQFVLSNFARQIARFEAGLEAPVLRVGNLDAARDFLHVRDVVEAYEQVALKGEAGQVYNVCSGRAWTVREALDHLRDRAKTSFTVDVEKDRVRRVDIPEVRGSRERISTGVGWQPHRAFDEMLGELLEYWREQEAPASS